MWIAIGAALIIAVGLIVWEVWICEGAHLGPRFVTWLYDVAAERYDRIKDFDWEWEREFVGEPVAAVVSGLRGARVLDVGAGTGRVVRSLPPGGRFEGSVVCLEPSARMLRLGRELAGSGPARWVQARAVPLPFAGEAFDLVVCLETLEFTPDPQATLRELVRVLYPGGWLLISNRIGPHARWILRRTFPSQQFPEFLRREGLREIEVYPWQLDYDLAWAQKPGL